MSMSDRDGWIWYDGKMVPWREATTHVLTHSLHYGLAVFEGLRAYKTSSGPAIFRLREHTERLFNSARIFMMQLPFTTEQLIEAQRQVVRANKLEQCYLRPIAFYGSEKMGVSPKGASVHVAVAAWPWGAYLGEDGLQKGIRVKTSSYARHHINVTMVRSKTAGHYVNSILAHLEATRDGYDEALLLDTEGFVAEGAGENLFIVRDGELIEPELVSGLTGITRRTVMELARGEKTSFESEFYITECTWMRKHGWRTPQWKLIVALEPDFHFKPAVELYNLIEDPHERTPLEEDGECALQQERQQHESSQNLGNCFTVNAEKKRIHECLPGSSQECEKW